MRKEGAIFSRAADCAGVVAAFGMDNQRTVLSEIESFGLPISAAESMKLPKNLVNLNRSLHSMRGAEHATQKRLLVGMLNGMEPLHRSVWSALEGATAKWIAEPVRLVSRMRELILHASLCALFGEVPADPLQLALLLQTYFHLRRETTSARGAANREIIDDLVEVGDMLDRELRTFIRSCRGGSSLRPGVLPILARDARLSENEIVGHMNVFFISTTEPVAIALSWILLVLSQLPELRIKLQNELRETVDGATPSAPQINTMALLDCVINETLRLLPPNALMVRITTKPAPLDGVLLPARCEVVLSPFISHRDDAFFPRANEFVPDRWRGTVASPYVYFPFGAGGHSCIGRSIAIDIIKTALTFLLPRFDLLLAGNQEIDSAIRIQFMPSPDPLVSFYPVCVSCPSRSGAVTGPLAKLLNLTNRAAA
jgi:cytochrome P450